MRKQKRVWLLASLLGEDVAFVQPKVVRPHVTAGTKLLLAGDEHARGLAAALARFTLDAKADFALAIRPRGIHAINWLCYVLGRARPDVVILAMEPAEMTCALPRPLWLPPPGSVMPPGVDVLPSSAIPGWRPSAKGYAAWAARAWRMVG